MIKLDDYLNAKNLIEWNIQWQLGLTQQSVKKGDLFLEEGQHCHYFYFVLKGLVRLYYIDLQGNEITHWFANQNTMITSPFSFLKKEKNILFFEAVEDTELILLTHQQLDAIIKKLEPMGEVIRKMYAEFAMVLSRRVMSIHTETAEARYLRLIDEHPYLFQKAKLAHIASYLGITPQSLSRIRRNL